MARSENYISGNRNLKKSILVLILIFTVIVTLIGVLALWSFYSCARAGIVKDTSFTSILTWFSSTFSVPLCPLDIYTLKFIGSNIWIILIADAAVALFLLLTVMSKDKFEKVGHGSAHWATKQELKAFSKKENNMPLADGVYLTKEAEAANNNVFVLAAPGGGKSFRVIIPAIEALTREGTEQGSFFCTDTKGALYRDTVKMVRDRGVKTYLLNLSDPWYSNRYNPLYNIHPHRKVTEIAKLALAYTKNVRDEEASAGDGIWEDTFKQLMSAVWFYQYDFDINPITKQKESKALWRTAELIRSLFVGEKGKIDENSELARIVEAVRRIDPLHPMIASYDFVAAGAAETVASVIFTAGSKISIFTYPEIESMTRDNDIFIDKLFEEPSAVYLNFEVGSPFKAIAALFIEQLFSNAYYCAERYPGGALPRPFKFFLDELPNICRIHSLPQIASTCRSYKIDLVVSVQSMQQLKAIFKDAEKTLMNNCVTHIYLGTGEADALKEISEALGKTTIEETSHTHQKSGQGGSSDSDKGLGRELALPSEIYSLPNKYAIVKMQHHPPIFAEKFKTEKEEWYALLGGKGNPENSCVIEKDFAELYVIQKHEYEKEKQARREEMLKQIEEKDGKL